MSPKTTAVLACVAALLGGYVYFVEIGGEADRKSAEQAESRIFADLDAERVTRLAFETLDGIDAHFERSGGVWRVVEPVEARADSVSIDAIASALAGLSSAGSITRTADLQEYGLAEGGRRVDLGSTERTYALRIGGVTPVGGNLYVLAVEGEPDARGNLADSKAAAQSQIASNSIALVEKFRLNSLSRNFADLRDRRIWRFSPAGIHRIELEWPGGSIVLTRAEESESVSSPHSNADAPPTAESLAETLGPWRITSPIDEHADQSVVRELLTDLEFLQAKGFIDDPAQTAGDRADDITFGVKLTGPVGTQTLQMGAARGDSRVVIAPEGRTLTIAAERLEDFERSISAYRDRTLASFDVGSARGFDFEGRDASGSRQRLRATLGEQGWQSDDAAVDSDALATLMLDLSALRADRIVADAVGDAALPRFGLAPAQATMRILRDDGSSLAEIALGKNDSARGQFLQREGSDKIFALDPTSEVSLPASWKAFIQTYVAPEAVDAPPE